MAKKPEPKPRRPDFLDRIYCHDETMPVLVNAHGDAVQLVRFDTIKLGDIFVLIEDVARDDAPLFVKIGYGTGRSMQTGTEIDLWTWDPIVQVQFKSVTWEYKQ